MSDKEKNVEAWHRAWWLARKELRRTWISYPATGIFVALFGLLVVGSFTSALDAVGSEVDPTGTYPLDIFFLAIAFVLNTNAFSRDYLASWFDTFSQRLVFLRSLPISAREVVMNRMLTMLPALALNSLVFFLVLYMLAVRRAPELLSPAEYLWFAATWVGISLLLGGSNLYLEMSVRGKLHNLLCFGLVVSIFVLIGLLHWLLGIQLVFQTVVLAQEYGPLPAFLALLVGAAGFALWAWAAARRVERRDLSP